MGAKPTGDCTWVSARPPPLGVGGRYTIDELVSTQAQLKIFSTTPFKRDSWGDLAGIVREVWGSTRGTPMPCRWFLGFAERQAPRRYRMVVLG
jgi:hypothetical protein